MTYCTSKSFKQAYLISLSGTLIFNSKIHIYLNTDLGCWTWSSMLLWIARIWCSSFLVDSMTPFELLGRWGLWCLFGLLLMHELGLSVEIRQEAVFKECPLWRFREVLLNESLAQNVSLSLVIPSSLGSKTGGVLFKLKWTKEKVAKN